MNCYLRNEAGIAEIPTISTSSETGKLWQVGFGPASLGTRVRVLVNSYSGPDDLRGLLIFKEGDGDYWGAMVGAKLVRVAEVNIGVSELIFEAKSKNGVNSPTVFTPWEVAQRYLSGPIQQDWVDSD